MCRHQCKAIGITKNQGNTTPQGNTIKPQQLAPEMEIQELPDKQFRVIILQMVLRSLQENSDQQVNIRKIIQE